MSNDPGDKDETGKEQSSVKTQVQELHMQKRVERKEDGRHLLYYSFSDEQPLPDNNHKQKIGQ